MGTKKLRNIGGDLGGAIKGFKGALQDDKKSDETAAEEAETVKEADTTDAKS